MTSIRRFRPGPLPIMHIKPNIIIAWIMGTGFGIFLSLLKGSPLKNRSHITVVYESTMSYREPVYRLPHPKSSFFFRDLLLVPRSSYYSKRLRNRSFPDQREWEFDESLQVQGAGSITQLLAIQKFFLSKNHNLMCLTEKRETISCDPA